jgi:hypothetical protein
MNNTENIKEFHKCNYLNPMKDNAYSMLNRCINDVNYKCNKNCDINLVSIESDNMNAFYDSNLVDKDNNIKKNINNINENRNILDNKIINNLEGFKINLDTSMEPQPTVNDFKLDTDVQQEYIFFNNNQGYIYNINNSEYIKLVNNGILDIYNNNNPEPYEDICYPYNYAGINNNGNILCSNDNNINTELYNLKDAVPPNYIPPSLR